MRPCECALHHTSNQALRIQTLASFPSPSPTLTLGAAPHRLTPNAEQLEEEEQAKRDEIARIKARRLAAMDPQDTRSEEVNERGPCMPCVLMRCDSGVELG
eukprot:3075401-Rhodomonas_salina.1